MRAHVVRGVAVVAVVMTAAGGCSLLRVPSGSGPPRPLSQQTLDEVETDVKAIEQALIVFVPPELIAGPVESARGSILGCASGGASWGSHTSVPVMSQPDLDELARELQTTWDRAGEFDFDLTEASTGDPRLVLSSPTLGRYYVERVEDTLQVASFSTCFAYDAERDGHRWEIGAE